MCWHGCGGHVLYCRLAVGSAGVPHLPRLCTNCSTGTYSATVGANSKQACIACPLARYSSITGAADIEACNPCGAGNETGGAANETGGAADSSTCWACAAGMLDHDSDSSTPCATCGNGTSSGAGATVCFACGAGTWARLAELGA